jgi:hypothetical protein
MDYSVNTRPLLQGSESETEEDAVHSQESEDGQGLEVDTKDLNPLFKVGNPKDRYDI